MTSSSESGQSLDKLFGRLAGRSAAKPRGRLPRDRFVAGETRRVHGGLVAARRILVVLVSVGLVYASTDLLRPLGALAVMSGVAVTAAAVLLVLPLLEIALGAGVHYEVLYKTAGRRLRKHRFEPSLLRFSDILAPLVISVFTQLAGFASLHSWVSRGFSGSYSEVLSPIGALCYSVATFSGGAIDVVPRGDGARALVALEALLGWLASVVAVATIVAWILRKRRRGGAAPASG